MRISEIVEEELRQAGGLKNPEKFAEFLEVVENRLITYANEMIDSNIEAQVNTIKTRHLREVADLQDKIKVQDEIRNEHVHAINESRDKIRRQAEEINLLRLEKEELEKNTAIGKYTVADFQTLEDERDFLRNLALTFASKERI